MPWLQGDFSVDASRAHSSLAAACLACDDLEANVHDLLRYIYGQEPALAAKAYCRASRSKRQSDHVSQLEKDFFQKEGGDASGKRIVPQREVTHTFGSGEKVSIAVKFAGMGPKILDPRLAPIEALES